MITRVIHSCRLSSTFIETNSLSDFLASFVGSWRTPPLARVRVGDPIRTLHHCNSNHYRYRIAGSTFSKYMGDGWLGEAFMNGVRLLYLTVFMVCVRACVELRMQAGGC